MNTNEIKQKVEVLNLINEGLNVIEIAKKTTVTEEIINKWLKNWNTKDKPKREIIDSIWKRLLELSKEDKLNTTEILNLSNSVKNLTDELLIFGKYINL
jgi:transposase